MIQNQDYPDRLAEADPRPAHTKKDTERFAKLAAEIESQEGRNVEMIKRKILKKGVLLIVTIATMSCCLFV